ncbi:DUF1993 domain-containing protein [Sphingobium algorifonticola]|uniref:DUF1993 domain-containing protein n=1 Tax=Sphingobium algorifonticola TaxID=2008318 RepID=A0A437JA59_9SPHN|nr:DUF1993 domain-containing protein [Sphingobium algorifonticola]RVT42192.1 DUF1993 domain-containing protein [Sphingobium algorifonticola]
MTLSDILIPTYVQMLKALSAWLGKAQERLSADAAQALLTARLAPDMFPLSTQIRFACVQALEGVFRARAEDFPPTVDILLNEGRNAAEHPGSIADALARIDETVALVESLAAQAIDLDPQTPIAHALPNGMIFDLAAEQYVRDWAIPQFYFHVMIAYAILRNNGVDLGKADYVAHMFGFLRPGTMPAQ